MSRYLSVCHGLGYDRFPKLKGYGTVPADEALHDDLNDVLAAKLRQFWRARNLYCGWTREIERLRGEVDQFCLLYGYRGLWVDSRDYLVHRVGQSFLFDVPIGKRGNLAVFSGKRIRVVCTYSSTYHRFIRVGVLGDAPHPHKIEGQKPPPTSNNSGLLRMLRAEELVHTPHLLALFSGSWNGAGGMTHAFNCGLCVQAAVLHARRIKELTGAWPSGAHRISFSYGPGAESDVRTPIGVSQGKREILVRFEVHPSGAAVIPGRDHVGFNWCAFAL